MPDPALRDRLIEIIVGAIIDGGPLGDHPPNIADALLASEEWQAREAVAQAAVEGHLYSDCTPDGEYAPGNAICFLCAALARLAAIVQPKA